MKVSAMARRVPQVCLVAAILACAPAARAHPGYPGVVDTALGVKGITEKTDMPQGCQLCHVSPAGGTTQLSPFGTLLVTTYGLVESSVEQDPSLVNALAMLKSADPKLFMDMAKGIDPNSDQTVVAEAPPHPEYGCSLRPAPGTPTQATPWFGMLALVAMRWRRARQRSQ
jgi:hypothetical protein